MFWALGSTERPPSQMLIDSTAVKAHLCAAGGERGEQSLAIGRLRSGLTTKIHAFTARFCPPPARLPADRRRAGAP